MREVRTLAYKVLKFFDDLTSAVVAVLLMLWKQEEPGQDAKPGLNANIAGPILINVEKRLGMQKILASPKVELNITE